MDRKQKTGIAFFCKWRPNSEPKPVKNWTSFKKKEMFSYENGTQAESWIWFYVEKSLFYKWRPNREPAKIETNEKLNQSKAGNRRSDFSHKLRVDFLEK